MLKERLGLSNKPLFLIDGNAFFYRGFYAYPDLKRASDGFPTNALLMVLRLLVRILKDENPVHIAFILDGRELNFRKEIYPQYKSNRQSPPESLTAQYAPLYEALQYLGITCIIAEKGEADDYIASLAARYRLEIPVVIVGGDKDLSQCLAENVVIWDPSLKNEKLITLSEFQKEYGLQPAQWPDFQALVGDSADNIPGVPQIGPKTALKLLKTHPTLEILREGVYTLNPSEQKKMLPYLEEMFVYRELTRLKQDYASDISLESLIKKETNNIAMRGFVETYELYSLRKIFDESKNKIQQDKTAKIKSKQTQGLLPFSLPKLEAEEKRAIAVSTNIMPNIYGKKIGLEYVQSGFLLGAGDGDYCYSGDIEKLCIALASCPEIFVSDTKKILSLGEKWVSFLPIFFDVTLGAYLLQPEERNYSLERIKNSLNLPAEKLDKGLASELLIIGEILKKQIIHAGIFDLMENLEKPLAQVLVNMEKLGIEIDVVAFEDFLKYAQSKLDELTVEIYEHAGKEFNIRSSQQLAKILFEELGIKNKRKTAGGIPSTASEVLEGLIDVHPLIPAILEYRTFEKLRSTYLEPLPKLADKNNRIHTTFNQLATATGRLSSSNPNLQNIPIRSVFGRRMRQCFISAKGMQFVCADYSQIELRILAHMSEDKTLCMAFENNEDIHTHTAALLFDKNLKDISLEERRRAKTINFGLLYGMGAQKLGRELGIGLNQAKDFIQKYFLKLGRVKEFYTEIENFAKINGYVTTLGGRRRLLPEINSNNANLFAQARRMAINTVVQGTASDIIKKAMIEVFKSVKMKSLEGNLLLQIHDELLVECPQKNVSECGVELCKVMESMQEEYKLTVPLKVELGIGNNWDEAH